MVGGRDQLVLYIWGCCSCGEFGNAKVTAKLGRENGFDNFWQAPCSTIETCSRPPNFDNDSSFNTTSSEHDWCICVHSVHWLCLIHHHQANTVGAFVCTTSSGERCYECIQHFSLEIIIHKRDDVGSRMRLLVPVIRLCTK